MKRYLTISALLLVGALLGAGEARATCDLQQGINVRTGGDSSQVWATYWCRPASKWTDYTADWGSLSLTAPAATQAKVIAALKSGSTADLRALASSSTMPAGVKAQLLATQPPATVAVAKNGTAADRPTYAIVKATGLRATGPADGRALVGARAACSVAMITEGPSVYCSWVTPSGTTYTNIVTLVSLVP